MFFRYRLDCASEGKLVWFCRRDARQISSTGVRSGKSALPAPRPDTTHLPTHTWLVLDSTPFPHTATRSRIVCPLHRHSAINTSIQTNCFIIFIEFPYCLISHSGFDCLLVNCLLISCQIRDWLSLESIVDSVYDSHLLLSIDIYSCE